MPFKSEAQRRYLFVHEPKLAKKWAHKYGTPEDLPEHASNPHKRTKRTAMLDRMKKGY